MSPSKLTFTGIAALGLLAAGFYWQFAGAADDGASANAAQSAAQSAARATVGDRRTALLIEYTRQYVLLGKEVSPGMSAGRELAPTAFLNHQLQLHDTKWRVRSTDGLEASTYEVS